MVGITGQHRIYSLPLSKVFDPTDADTNYECKTIHLGHPTAEHPFGQLAISDRASLKLSSFRKESMLEILNTSSGDLCSWSLVPDVGKCRYDVLS
jgi:hypothetical protein